MTTLKIELTIANAQEAHALLNRLANSADVCTLAVDQDNLIFHLLHGSKVYRQQVGTATIEETE